MSKLASTSDICERVVINEPRHSSKYGDTVIVAKSLSRRKAFKKANLGRGFGASGYDYLGG